MYWPFIVYAILAVSIAAGMLLVSHFVGPRHRERATGEPYESGVLPTGSARLRLSIQFYLTAILFVIFDLELVYIFAWAVAIRELGWEGYLGVVVFIAILLSGLIYEWRMGSLDWAGAKGRTRS
ncbi:MAG: NADH-quinone oxidoreductase subunit A [Verrucomicrobia bacterium]|nr:NADH-quinone oxidoreductase subunit A [Verrucomicrobiota bacterium]